MPIIEKILIISMLIGFILIAYLAFKENVIEYAKMTFKHKLIHKYTIKEQLKHIDLFIEIYGVSKNTKISVKVKSAKKAIFTNILKVKKKDDEFFYYLPIHSKHGVLKPGKYELEIESDSDDQVHIHLNGYRSYYNTKFIALSLTTLVVFIIAFTLIYVAGIAPNL